MDEITETYLKVESLFNIKIKAQIKNSGIFFNNLLFVKDLVREVEYYALYVNNSAFRFENLEELYDGLIKFINEEIKEVENESENYNNLLENDLKSKKSFIASELDDLGYKEEKLYKLKKQIEKNKNNYC